MDDIDYKIFGTRYRSLADISRDFDLPVKVISHRIEKIGLEPEVAVSLIGKLSFKAEPIRFDGKWFGSKSEIYRTYNITKTTVAKRVKQGMRFEDAVKMPTAQNSIKSGRSYVYGIFHKIKKIAYIGYSQTPKSRKIRHFYEAENNPILPIHFFMHEEGIPNFRFDLLACAENVVDGLEVEKILIEDYQREGYELINQNIGGAGGGKRSSAFDYYVQYEGNKVDYSVFYDRVCKHGWRYKDAITVPKGVPASNPRGKNSFRYKDVWYKGITDFSAQNNVDRHLIKKRLKDGMPLEVALTDVLARTKKKHRGTLTVEGVTFPSVAAAAKAYGMKFDTVAARLDAGFEPEVAMLMPARQGRRLMNAMKSDPDIDQFEFLRKILSKTQ